MKKEKNYMKWSANEEAAIKEVIEKNPKFSLRNVITYLQSSDDKNHKAFRDRSYLSISNRVELIKNEKTKKDQLINDPFYQANNNADIFHGSEAGNNNVHANHVVMKDAEVQTDFPGTPVPPTPEKLCNCNRNNENQMPDGVFEAFGWYWVRYCIDFLDFLNISINRDIDEQVDERKFKREMLEAQRNARKKTTSLSFFWHEDRAKEFDKMTPDEKKLYAFLRYFRSVINDDTSWAMYYDLIYRQCTPHGSIDMDYNAMNVYLNGRGLHAPRDEYYYGLKNTEFSKKWADDHNKILISQGKGYPIPVFYENKQC